jgi:hypothetical protein
MKYESRRSKYRAAPERQQKEEQEEREKRDKKNRFSPSSTQTSLQQETR